MDVKTDVKESLLKFYGHALNMSTSGDYHLLAALCTKTTVQLASFTLRSTSDEKSHFGGFCVHFLGFCGRN